MLEKILYLGGSILIWLKILTIVAPMGFILFSLWKFNKLVLGKKEVK